MKRPQSQSAIKEETDCDVVASDYATPTKNIKNEDFFKCEFCSTVCNSISHLQTHTLKAHLPDRMASFSCPTANSSPRIACQQCEETFDNFALFAVHMKNHISSTTPQIFFCPLCPAGSSFKDKNSQLEHLTTQHLQVQVTQLVCEECGSSFNSMNALSNHFVESHKKIKCSACDYTTDSEQAFKDHSKVHCHQTIMYGCAICGSAYSTQQNLMFHVQLTHDQETLHLSSLSTPPSISPKPVLVPKPRVLQCSVCDEKVLGEEGLDDHRLQKHCKIRFSDKCADCQELLISEASFVEHCIRHANDHNHHCPVCRQNLRSDAQIHAHCSYHMNPIIHQKASASTTGSLSPNNNPTVEFICPLCGEKLDDGLALIEHSKRHL